MNGQTTSLPSEIQQSLLRLHELKVEYLGIRERLVGLTQRIEKHQKTAAAASEESARVGEQWRQQFREQDGELTKAIRDLKRQELDGRELAEEYTNLAKELQPEFELCQIETDKARRAFNTCREGIAERYLDHSLAESAAALLASPAGQVFISNLEKKGLINPKEQLQNGSARLHANEIEARNAAEKARTLRLGRVVESLINEARSSFEAPEDCTWQKLKPIGKLPVEVLPKELESTIAMQRKLKDLSVQLGQQPQASA